MDTVLRILALAGGWNHGLHGNVNLSNPNSTLTSPSVGKITAAGPARIAQFALKILF